MSQAEPTDLLRVVDPPADPVTRYPTFDDPVHFWWLKRMALSPAHALAAYNEEYTRTRSMLIGTIVHTIVLGPRKDKPLVRWGDQRKGNAWIEFERRSRREYGPDVEIVTASEWAAAEPVAEAIMRHPVARSLLFANPGMRYEVPLEWRSGGMRCATGGIDFIGPGYIGELKTTTCSEPVALQRHAAKLLYHAQLAHYEEGANANGIDTSQGLYMIGAEVDPPYAVTCMRLAPDTSAQGRKSCVLWLEKLRACVENKHWPEYTSTVLDFELPPWYAAEDVIDAD